MTSLSTRHRVSHQLPTAQNHLRRSFCSAVQEILLDICVCIHVYVYIYIYVHMIIYIYIYMFRCVCVCMCKLLFHAVVSKKAGGHPSHHWWMDNDDANDESCKRTCVQFLGVRRHTAGMPLKLGMQLCLGWKHNSPLLVANQAYSGTKRRRLWHR